MDDVTLFEDDENWDFEPEPERPKYPPITPRKGRFVTIPKNKFLKEAEFNGPVPYVPGALELNLDPRDFTNEDNPIYFDLVWEQINRSLATERPTLKDLSAILVDLYTPRLIKQLEDEAQALALIPPVHRQPSRWQRIRSWWQRFLDGPDKPF